MKERAKRKKLLRVKKDEKLGRAMIAEGTQHKEV